MSAPTQQDLLTLRFAHAGAPAPAVGVSSVDTKTLAFSWQGAPVVVTSSPAATAGQSPVLFVWF